VVRGQLSKTRERILLHHSYYNYHSLQLRPLQYYYYKRYNYY
jgi:hypothetical protein